MLTPSQMMAARGGGEARPYRSPLPRLRIGSSLTTRRGTVFRVREAMVLVAENGGESPSVIVERFRDGQVTEFLLTVGILANLTRGAMHRPGAGCLIDWGQALRQRQCAVRRLVFNPPPTARR
jgi:hypothetical protein